MRSIAATVLLIVVVSVASAAHGASPQQKFDKLLDKYTMDFDDLSNGKFRAKVLCYCTVGVQRTTGVVVRNPTGTGTTLAFCAIPSFNADGSVSTVGICDDFDVLAR